MKKIKYILFFSALTALLLPRCDKDNIYQEVDCSLCYATPPDSGFVRPEITIDPAHPAVPVTVYEGPVESGKVVFRDTFSVPTPRIEVPVGKAYSLTAAYLQNGDTILVVEGDKLEVKKAVGQCGGPCYVITGGFYDLRLK